MALNHLGLNSFWCFCAYLSLTLLIVHSQKILTFPWKFATKTYHKFLTDWKLSHCNLLEIDVLFLSFSGLMFVEKLRIFANILKFNPQEDRLFQEWCYRKMIPEKLTRWIFFVGREHFLKNQQLQHSKIRFIFSWYPQNLSNLLEFQKYDLFFSRHFKI